MTAASVGPAVNAACLDLKQKLQDLLVNKEGSAFYKIQTADIVFDNGFVSLVKDSNTRIAYADILKSNNLQELETTKLSLPHSKKSIRCILSGPRLCRCMWILLSGTVRVTKVVSVIGGRG